MSHRNNRRPCRPGTIRNSECLEGGIYLKNGRALKGHRRVAVAIGPSAVRNRPPTRGWDVSCICGWQGGNWPNRDLACKAYREHIDYQIDYCPIRCLRCGVEKPLSKMRRDYRYICLECFSLMGTEWQKEHPVQSARTKRNSHLLRKFGITLKEAEELLARQGGVCAICHKAITDRRGYSAHVDHDHGTGAVRGILCLNCNTGLGSFQDDISRLEAAIEYLRRGPSRSR